MALTRRQTVHTYASLSGGREYLYDVIVDGQGLVSVRNVRTPTGPLRDSVTSLPQTVLEEMSQAVSLVQTLQLESEVASGSVTFTGQYTQSVVLPMGAVNNSNYHVYVTTSDGVYLSIASKTTSGFSLLASTLYGTVEVPKVVTYSVVVKTGQTSDMSGDLTFTSADSSEQRVEFSSLLPSSAYRVVLEPQGFFLAYVPEVSKTRAGFTVVLGHTLAVGESVTVSYDVFV